MIGGVVDPDAAPIDYLRTTTVSYNVLEKNRLLVFQLGKRSVLSVDKLVSRVSALFVGSNIIGQFVVLAATRKSSPQAQFGDTMRGIDFYSGTQFTRAVIRSAVRFRKSHGYVPRLTSPTTFNEHIFVRMFFAPLRMPSLADKLAAKDRVRLRVGEEFLPDVVWVGEDANELFEAQFSAGRYVLKANHGCNWNIFLDLPGDLSTKRDEVTRAKQWLTFRHGYEWGEWFYCAFKPKLFLEEFINFSGTHTPDDYKFFCFNGKAVVIEVDVDRLTRLRSAFYTPNWKHLPVAYRHPPIECPQPHNLKEMVRVAEAIAEGLDFVRVDLYSDRKSRIKFGEMTFAPGAAISRFSDVKFDRWLGSHFVKDLGSETYCEFH
jgi:TupA-like ATPgrasp